MGTAVAEDTGTTQESYSPEERLEFFARWLEAFWSMIRDKRRVMVRRYVFEGSYAEVFSRTTTRAHPIPVDPKWIESELRAARDFGLFFGHTELGTLRWRLSTTALLKESRVDFRTLAREILEP